MVNPRNEDMNRESQIDEAAYDYEVRGGINYYDFTVGAKWADEHPAWNLCKELIPDSCEDVIFTDGHFYHIGYYDTGKCRWYSLEMGVKKCVNIIAWIPIPVFNK